MVADPDFEVRRLGGTDLRQMRDLLEIFSDAFADPATYRDRPPSDPYLRTFLGREDAIVVTGEADGVILGGLVAYVLTKFEQERSEVYIYDLAVSEAHRRRGVARALINELRRITAQIGAYVIYVQADLGDDPAIALYESLGTREDVLHFDIEV